MAEITKYQAHSIGRLFLHNNRQKDDGVEHSNRDINNERTCFNYHIGRKGAVEDVKKRMNELYHAKRKDLIVLAEVVVTLPQDVKEDDEKKFFRACYDFYAGDFGKENIINAVVHKDETTPHIHIDFMPVKTIESRQENMSEKLKQNIKEYEREHDLEVKGMLCAKEVLTREYFQTMHPRLYKYMAKELGYECEILNGATAGGNKTVLEMKMERYQKKVEQKGAEADILEDNIRGMLQKLDDLGIDRRFFEVHEVFTLMEKLQTENEMYRDIVARYGLSLPQETMHKIATLADSLKTNFTVHTGLYLPADTFVIETYKNKERMLPQKSIIEADKILKNLVENVRPNELIIEVIRDKKVILFPTDDIEDTFHNLLRLKALEKNLKHISFPQITNDTMHLAETILRECHFRTDYYLTSRQDDIDRSLTEEIRR